MEHPDRAIDLKLVLDSPGDGMTGIAARAVAIYDDVFSRLPFVEERADEPHPFVFVQKDRAGDVLAVKSRAGPGIDPHDLLAPRLRGRESHFVFAERLRLLVAELDGTGDDGRREREGEQNGELAQWAN